MGPLAACKVLPPVRNLLDNAERHAAPTVESIDELSRLLADCSFAANTILRDPAWRKKDLEGALRVSTADAARIGLANGGTAKLTTKRASAVVTVSIDDALQPGHISLPNGFGLDHLESGERLTTGVATNELTAMEDRDPWAGTPWHKTTPLDSSPSDRCGPRSSQHLTWGMPT